MRVRRRLMGWIRVGEVYVLTFGVVSKGYTYMVLAFS